MQQNKISVTISTTVLNEVLAAIETIQTKLPFLISLTVAERREMAKMGDKTLAFVTKAYEYATADGDKLPHFIELAEFGKDVNAFQHLMKILRPLLKLAESVEDTAMLAGSEAYGAGLTYYNYQKAAMKAGAPGVKTIVADLAERFPGRGKKVTSTPETEE